MEKYEELEVEFGKWAHCQHPVSCSSGTAALQLALSTLKVVGGRVLNWKVIVPEFTMYACPRAVTMAGLQPVFVDCGDDLLIDCNQLEDVLRQSVGIGAMMPVHIYGRVCDMATIGHLAAYYGLLVVEDLAEAHGVPPSPFADASCWSFYRNKIVCGEEGGLVDFKYSTNAKRAKQLRCQGFTDDHDFMHLPGGFNARMSNAHADLILKSLRQADENITKRRLIESWYGRRIPVEWHMPGTREAVWVYDLRLPRCVNGYETIDSVVKSLNQLGIAARHSFKPMSAQPEYFRIHNRLNAYRLSKEVMYLPVDPGMDEARVDFICEALFKLVKP